MHKSITLLSILILALSLGASAQHTHCFASEKWQEQLAADPGLSARKAEIDAFTENWIRENQDQLHNRAVVTIPVVVHVVYSNSTQNISNQQVYSQIDVLNKDYRALNSDIGGVPSVWSSLVADVEIEFALATCDPNGWATNGITRTETTVTNWNGSDNVKVTSLGGHDPWPAADYLNIWVCNIGSGLLGYAYQPGISPLLDGVVIGFRYFGDEGTLSNTYDLGRTATHEIGHYFNLDHLWGVQADNLNCNLDDAVADTPKQQEPNYGCGTTYPNETCGTGANSDMFNNYMDYGNDQCLFFFTNGQKARMLAALNGPRVSLLSSEGLNQCPVGIEEHILESSLNVYPNPASDVINVQLDQKDNLPTEIRVIDLNGKQVLSETNVRLGHAAYQLNVSELNVGTYVLELRSETELVTRKINIIK